MPKSTGAGGVTLSAIRGAGVVAVLTAGVWVVHAAEPKKGTDDSPVKRGEYLANEVAHCTHCHSPRDGKGQPDRGRLLQGATLPIRPKEPTKNWAEKSPDITRGGLAGRWSEADMVKFLTTGKNPDGEGPVSPMPVFHLHDDDAQAVALYLRSLPGKGK
jgi:mono/diheme cytochrome c family protein